MSKFDFLFGVALGQLVLGHSDNLSKTLQKKTCSAAEGQEVAQMVIKTLQSIRTEQAFDLFWTKLAKLSETLDIDEAQLPRQRKVASRYEDGLASCHFHDTPKAYYRHIMRQITVWNVSRKDLINQATICIPIWNSC